MYRSALKLAFAAVALAAAAAHGKTFRFVQISDTHQGQAIHQWRYRKAVEQINALPFPVECVVHTGDVVSNGVKSPDVAGIASNIFASIKAPRIMCPGNHDIVFQYSDPTNRFLRTAEAYQRHFGPLAQSFESSNALYVAVCTETLRRNAAPEIPGFDPLAWLDETLSRCPDKPAFVCTHVPDCDDYFLGEYTPGWENADGLRAWREVLGRHPNVRAVLAGHFHRNCFVEHPDGIPTIVASCFASFWQRQASYRVFTWEDGLLSWQDAYIADPPEGTHINRYGFIVDDSSDAPEPAAPVDTGDQTVPPLDGRDDRPAPQAPGDHAAER